MIQPSTKMSMNSAGFSESKVGSCIQRIFGWSRSATGFNSGLRGGHENGKLRDLQVPCASGRRLRSAYSEREESPNRPRTQRETIFGECPWALQGKTGVYCYEWHEGLLHNPVFLPGDIERFAELVARRGLGPD